VLGANGPELHRAADPARDQSYFLFVTTREQLGFLRFPLGDMPKSAVREIAKELKLAVAEKPDSQDICFVPNGDYASVVKKVRPEAGQPGEIVDLEGRVLGQHRGLIHFTVGQRRGLEIGGQPEPLYVVRLEPETKRVVAGPRSALAVAGARLSGVNWLGEHQSEGLTAKVRSMARPAPVRFEAGSIRFEAPEYGVAPGQAAAIYQGSRVLGGGWIEETEPFRGRHPRRRIERRPGHDEREQSQPALLRRLQRRPHPIPTPAAITDTAPGPGRSCVGIEAMRPNNDHPRQRRYTASQSSWPLSAKSAIKPPMN
jgi:tRNA-specific 2-thiouridylase